MKPETNADIARRYGVTPPAGQQTASARRKKPRRRPPKRPPNYPPVFDSQ